jgi:hypothetical protein
LNWTAFDFMICTRLICRSANALLVVLTLISVLPAEAALIISEIMYNAAGTDKDPAATPPFDREWVEIYNTSDAAIDLGGWQFGNSSAGLWTTPFPTGTTLGVGRPLVLTGNTTTFDAAWGNGLPRLQVGSFPTLGNTSGTIAVRNQTGIVQDTVSYQSSGSWPISRGSQGNSISLLPSALNASANNTGTNWHPASGGVYGARWVNGGGHGENNGSPGYVPTVSQAAFAPSPDAAWSMVVMPDTQNYSKDSRDLPIFSQMTTWIRNHRDEFKIELVMQEGDIVNNNDTDDPTTGDQTGDQQWANARAAMSILDGHVPYIMSPGNHDIGTTNAQSRDTQFNTYFQPTQNPLNYTPASGGNPASGILRGLYQPGHLENAYFEFNAPDGRNLLIFALEFMPRQAVVNWANSVADLPQFADHTAVLLTHTYLDWNNTLTNPDVNDYGLDGDGNGGLQLWQELVKVNGNFEMTFNGHVGGDGVGYVRGIGDNGNAVHQMLLNTQFETNGGNGWFRMLEFLDDGTTFRVRTFSPFLDLSRTDPANSYTIKLSPLPTRSGDFDGDGDVDGRDFLIWQRNPSVGDLADWQANYGAGTLSEVTAVPEPTGLATASLALMMLLAIRHSRSI